MPAPLPRARRVFYLHGFASSSSSTKASYFAERLLAKGVSVYRPDFNQPEFASLTMTRMLDRLDQEVNAAAGDGPVVLMGSSLGGTLAILAAARMADRVDRLVLMAPAVMFARPGHHLLPPERIERWRDDGALPFFHYAYGEERLLKFAFYEDTLRYDAFETAFTQPTIIFQGRHDTSVDPHTVEQFAAGHANATLSLLDDDHQLIASLPQMWSDVEGFLGLVE
jgi:pimeloyl-ACP methyl ester carboxylesterase